MVKNFKHPYKTFDEQIAILKSRGIEINDYEFAKNALMTFPYYSIVNGYKDIFLKQKEPDIYRKGTSFEMLYQVHWIDIQVSNIIFKYSLAVEERLKALVSNIVAQNFSIEEEKYLDKRNYSKSKSQRGKINDFMQAIEDAKQSSKIARHYINEEGNLPPWIAAEVISFGSMVNWYSALSINEKKSVVSLFLSRMTKQGVVSTDDKLQFCKICLEQVYRFRNLSAHGNRTFKLQLSETDTQKIRFLENFSILFLYKAEKEITLPRNGLFSVIVSIMVLLDDQYLISTMIDELKLVVDTYGNKTLFNGKSIYDLFEVDKNFIIRLKRFMNMKFPTNN
ncbi:Abi family protein [Limosilactobacillus sp. c9Ua_26_M]|uniref:Abi family protein n=1 Tax=Limosilactobacillus urinaemulieris TaxID=2742600 RepID=A0ABR8ZLN3_9LACO|nr:Abi family protein [Limosilactobacillus urinaemulieris]MBD8085586.1 Abi family protein [Limosilactobacillus urinaemulieris]